MKKILLLWMMFIYILHSGFAQTYRNEWIDFSKTYYKFTVSADGVYRINGTDLPAAIAGNNVADFKLWRNGAEVTIFTSVSTGTLGSTGYIEFWGNKNDGKADTEMYRDSTYQTNDMVSLETDNSTYFLTVNPGGANARFSNPIYDLSNPGIAKPYFIDTLAYGYRAQLWGGDAQFISNEYVRSSSYDKNEGFTSAIFNSMSFTLSGLQAYTQSDAPTMRFIHSGGGAFIGVRNLSTYLNDSLINVQTSSYFNNYLCDVQQIPLSRISNDAITVHLLTNDGSQYGGMMIAKYKLIYPRKFDFSNQQSFVFDLPADNTGTYLEISDFNSGGVSPILIDLANGRRYNCTIDGNGLIKVKMQPSTIIQKCILYSGAPSFVSYVSVGNFTSRNFIDYTQTTNQGDFLLIANKNLNSGGSNNQVEAYRSYKSSTIGGGFNSKIYDVDELTDQFGYGIRKHPIAIRNFLQYARDKFPIAPKFVLLVGHGVDYSDFYYNQTDANSDVLNMVPTWGYPASDILLSAVSKVNPIPATPIGRLSVINSTELKNYLQKLKEFDISNADTSNSQASKSWKKKIGLLIGASDDVAVTITNSMLNYQSIVQDTLIGANAQIYSEYKNPDLYQTTVDLTNEINNGVSMLSYFGHSSTSGLQFNLSNPNNYTNTNGKYPFFSISGCNAGDFFVYDVNRITNAIYTISEQFMIAPERGAIGVLASTHFGVVNTLDYFNIQFFIAAGMTRYGKSLGEIYQKTNDSTWKLYNGDFLTRLTLEENTLNGDPSIKLFSSLKPDYSIENQNIAINPSFISMVNDSFQVAVSIQNLGKATKDSINIQIQRQFPNGTIKTIGLYKLKGVKYADSISFKVPIIGNIEKGTNYIIVTLDPTNLIDEISETNNTATVPFVISADQIKPVYPYPYSIVNKTAFKLIATTVDPFQANRTYQVQMDTTELFNSPLLASSQTTQVGGEVEFTLPLNNLQDGTVYYWRVAPMVSGSFVNYQTSSFLYNPNGSLGWNQSSLYQHFKSSLSSMSLDSTTRNFGFASVATSVQLNHSVYNYGGFTENDFTTFVNGVSISHGDCSSPAILFIVLDNIHFKPWLNNPNGGLYGSFSPCNNTNIFEFYYWGGASQRKTIMDFMNIIPDGYYVIAKLIPYPYPDNSFVSSYTATWRNDTLTYGKGQSLPDYLMKQGFTDIDQETYPRFWTFIYKKNDSTHFRATSLFSNSMYDITTLSVNCPVPASSGNVTSPVFGPAKQWQKVHWSGHTLETSAPYADSAIVQVIGITASGTENVLYNLNRTQLDYDISGINATAYPNIKLRLLTSDTVYATPWQLDKWRLDYTPVPEGALAPNLFLTANDVVTNATLPIRYKFGIAFKNISDAPFDSLKLKLKLVDANNNVRLVALPKTKPLISGDTANIYFEIPADTMQGVYNMYLGVNIDTTQPEQFLYNNFLYRQFTVNNSLPVNFIGFEVVPSTTDVSLQWQVTNEAGFNYYNVERSIDGVQFSTIGKVLVKNNNALMNAYDLLDKNPSIGKNYYRIKIINQDGTAEYSSIRVVTFGKGNAIKVYPNPVKNILQVTIPSDGKPVTLILTNATGQQLLQNNTLGSTQIDMTKFAAGIYYLQAKDATGSTIFRVEKQ